MIFPTQLHSRGSGMDTPFDCPDLEAELREKRKKILAKMKSSRELRQKVRDKRDATRPLSLVLFSETNPGGNGSSVTPDEEDDTDTNDALDRED